MLTDTALEGSAATAASTSIVRPLSVTHVVRQYLPSIGGMEEVVRNIALQQKRHGSQHVRIITLDRLFRNSSRVLPPREEIEGIEVVRLPYFGSSRYPLCPRILRELGQTDVVNVHGVDFFFDFLALTKISHKCPLILSTHGGFFHTEFASRTKKIYFNTITRLSSMAYSRVVATSVNDGRLFAEIVGAPKLQVIENGVDIDKFSGQASAALVPRLIYFGRWSANKGLLEALEFLRQLRNKSTEWTLTIAGREYDLTEAQLRGHIDAMGLGDAVALVANPSDAEIKRLINQASYFLCLSHHEGFGIAPIEGMSAGLLPVLSAIPPFTRLIGHTQQGIIVDPRQPQIACDELVNVHGLGEAAYQQRRAAAIAAAEAYAWQRVAKDYLGLYQQIGGGR